MAGRTLRIDRGRHGSRKGGRGPGEGRQHEVLRMGALQVGPGCSGWTLRREASPHVAGEAGAGSHACAQGRAEGVTDHTGGSGLGRGSTLIMAGGAVGIELGQRHGLVVVAAARRISAEEGHGMGHS